MAKVDSSRLIVDNHSTEEVINYLTLLLKTNRIVVSDGVASQNAYQIGCVLCNVENALNVLEALDEKLNGKKEATVVQ